MKDILVLGDACVDRFVRCHVNKLCPEAPVPLLQIKNVSQNYGMAANVMANIQALIPYVVADSQVNDNYLSVVKTRFIDEKTNHMFIRVDEPAQSKRINILYNIDFEKYKLVVISDYNKGFLTEEDINYIVNKHNNVFIDTKKKIGPWIKNAKYIKINNVEYNHSEKEIKKYRIANKIIQTCGGDGVLFRRMQYTVDKVGVVDVSGAGDTFLAALVVQYLATGNNIEEAIKFANKCASKVVQERGVTVIDPKTVL